MIFDCGRLKCLEIYFWRNIVVLRYSTHSISCSSGASISIYCTTRHTLTLNAVELHSWDTALIRYHKSTLLACALKPCLLNILFVCCSNMCFFWVRTPETRTVAHLKACQTAADYWTKLSFMIALILSKTQGLHINSRLCLNWK